MVACSTWSGDWGSADACVCVQQEGAGTGWTRREVALEMGGILKAFDVSGSGQSRTSRPSSSLLALP